MTFARTAVIAAFAIVGWGVCAATIAIGFDITTERGALILHAIVAPSAFAVLSWFYFTRFAYTGPVATALIFLGVVVALDVFVVALLIQRSFAMFASALGTWAPLSLIFASTWSTGAIVQCTKRAR
jgi:hypothetical protein